MGYISMPEAVQPCKGESDQFLKLHERGAKLIALNPDKSPSNGFVAATRADIQSHHGAFGIFPISAGLVCIDVDEGDPQLVLMRLALNPFHQKLFAA